MKKNILSDTNLGNVNIEIGHGSVYRDLGHKNYEEMGTKADLVIELSKAIKLKRLTQTQAAEIIGLTQPKLSELLNGRFRGYSVERLMHFLNEFGQDIKIVVQSKPRNRKACISVYHLDKDLKEYSPISTRR
jgi:predicted XRE-type DNA-binding protein